VNVQVQEAVVGQAQELRATLAADMPPREVAVCEDETFHPEICLVAIEPVSNFILLEQYAADRTAATWTQALERALTGLPVTVVRAPATEAKALRRHIERPRAQHVSDLFHGQQEVSKGTVCTWPAKSGGQRHGRAAGRAGRNDRPSGPQTRTRPVPAAGPRPSRPGPKRP
jgi:hypothetical protein